MPFSGLGTSEFDVHLDFLEESHRVFAPKTLVKELDACFDTG